MIFNASLVERLLRVELAFRSPAARFVASRWSDSLQQLLYILKLKAFTRQEIKMRTHTVYGFKIGYAYLDFGYNFKRFGLGISVDKYSISVDIAFFWLELQW